ncbi:hypothetical protein BC629DRAFT_636527 [Irpex lacteus]|nr:hypothetical protein BC629DRAFT_636527 [Irpex lacteus]
MKSSVPTHLQQEPGGTNGGSEISIQGWHEIYKDKGLLRGFHAKDSNGSDPYVPGQAIFELPDKPSYTLSNKSHRSDEEFISVAYQDGVLHGFSQKDWEMALGASLEAFAIGGISASGGYSGLKTKTNKKSAATNDRIRVISDDVIKASVCLEVSTLNLTKACRDAADTVVQTKTFESVVTFIEQFGVVFATQVVLGGSRFSIAHLTSGSQSDSCQVENKSHVEQQTKVAIPSLMSVNGGFSNDKQNAYSASNVIETSQEIKSWKQIGGLASADVEEWRRSLLQHKYWDVIKATKGCHAGLQIRWSGCFRDHP